MFYSIDMQKKEATRGHADHSKSDYPLRHIVLFLKSVMTGIYDFKWLKG